MCDDHHWVMAPFDANDTSLAYFASAPVSYRGLGGFLSFSRRLISSSLSPTERKYERGRAPQPLRDNTRPVFE